MRSTLLMCAALLCWIVAPGSVRGESDAAEAGLSLAWAGNILTVSGPGIPGGPLKIQYLEAFCRAGSTDRDWKGTVIPHKTEVVEGAEGGRRIRLRSTLSDGVVVDHTIVAGRDTVEFQVVATNSTDHASEAYWAQPCLRVDRFTGVPPIPASEAHLTKCFVFLEGRLARMPTTPWATKARYTPGQVWCPANVDRNDLNPRPLNPRVPSNGLIGCYSADESKIVAMAFEPYQELFQGTAVCVHPDFRIGGLAAGETKRIRGKLYVVDPDVNALLKRYEADFPEHHAASR